MTTFTPPTAESISVTDRPPGERDLWRWYGGWVTGQSVRQDSQGVWHTELYPYLGGDTHFTQDVGRGITTLEGPTEGILTAQEFFAGGHIHHITEAQRTKLETAGFGAGINIATPVVGTWKREELGLLERVLMTQVVGESSVVDVETLVPPFDPAHQPGEHPEGGEHERIVFSHAMPDPDGSGQVTLREFFLHSDTDGWENVHVVCEGVDPPWFGTIAGGLDNDLIPQGGTVLRFKPAAGEPDGRNKGVTINNGSFLGIPVINIGVWSALPGGTGFLNRQFGTNLFAIPSFPWAFEAFLVGSTVALRAWSAHDGHLPRPRWEDFTANDDGSHVWVVDLETQAGDPGPNPTPTGPGSSGLIVAHLGRDPRSQVRLRRTSFNREPSSLPL